MLVNWSIVNGLPEQTEAWCLPEADSSWCGKASWSALIAKQSAFHATRGMISDGKGRRSEPVGLGWAVVAPCWEGGGHDGCSSSYKQIQANLLLFLTHEQLPV